VIILAATPIGNLGDVSRRLVEVLENAEVIVAEDTRTTQKLMQALQIANRPRLIALHDHNEKQKAAELATLAIETDVVVVSDAGMPAISDPGYGLVAEAVAQGVTVTAIPGPSAVLMPSRSPGCRRIASPSRGSCPASRGSGGRPCGRSPQSPAPWSSSNPPPGWRRRSPTWALRSVPTAASPCVVS